MTSKTLSKGHSRGGRGGCGGRGGDFCGTSGFLERMAKDRSCDGNGMESGKEKSWRRSEKKTRKE